MRKGKIKGVGKRCLLVIHLPSRNIISFSRLYSYTSKPSISFYELSYFVYTRVFVHRSANLGD